MKATQSSGAKAAQTRRRNKILGGSVRGRMLLALLRAHEASERAKNRPGNGMRFGEYKRTYDRSDYAYFNYGRSRDARAADYAEKGEALKEAVRLAKRAKIAFGWAASQNERVPWLVYFDLPAGQVSFHTDERGTGPDYAGEWDGIEDASGTRIQATIQAMIDEETP